jgi:hypothetical protein
MRQLENEVALENSVKKLSDFINEDEAAQNEYSNALQKAKDIINGVPSSTLDKATIEDALLELQNDAWLTNVFSARTCPGFNACKLSISAIA